MWISKLREPLADSCFVGRERPISRKTSEAAGEKKHARGVPTSGIKRSVTSISLAGILAICLSIQLQHAAFAWHLWSCLFSEPETKMLRRCSILPHPLRAMRTRIHDYGVILAHDQVLSHNFSIKTNRPFQQSGHCQGSA